MGVEYDINKMCGNLSNKFAYISRYAALRPAALALTLSLISVEDEIYNNFKVFFFKYIDLSLLISLYKYIIYKIKLLKIEV